MQWIYVLVIFAANGNDIRSYKHDAFVDSQDCYRTADLANEVAGTGPKTGKPYYSCAPMELHFPKEAQ